MRVLKNSQQNNSETVTNDHYKEILKEKYLSLQERQEIIYELRLKQYNDGVSKKKARVSKNSRQNNSEKVTNESDKEMSKEKYISLEERQKFIDNLGINIIV